MVSSDLIHLFNNGRMVGLEAPQPAERNCGLFFFALHNQPTRGLGEEQHAADEDDSPGKLQCHWNSVAARVIPILGSIVDDGRDE